MKAAYVDTSCLVAVAFGEKGAVSLGRRLEGFDELFSSNLLEAEFRASLVREEVDDAPDLLSWFTWVLPDRPLSREFGKVLAAGYLRGADLWHVGCALFLAGGKPSDLHFLTLNHRQCAVAEQLGFAT